MHDNGFKKSLFGLNSKQVMLYLDGLSNDVEKKFKMKDDDIKDLKSKISDKETELDALLKKLEETETELENLKESSEKEIEDLKKAHQLEISELKIDFNRELAELNEKFLYLKNETDKEKDKISAAILNAEETAKKIIEDAQTKGEDIIAKASKKADEEKLKLKQTKADVTDFTSDIKKLLEKLNTDIKDKLKKTTKE